MTAADIRYGRRGGNWLPPEPKATDGPALPPGLVRVACGCEITWVVVPVDVGRSCHSCGHTMRQVADG